jgi:hypothetical protein
MILGAHSLLGGHDATLACKLPWLHAGSQSTSPMLLGAFM